MNKEFDIDHLFVNIYYVKASLYKELISVAWVNTKDQDIFIT